LKIHTREKMRVSAVASANTTRYITALGTSSNLPLLSASTDRCRNSGTPRKQTFVVSSISTPAVSVPR